MGVEVSTRARHFKAGEAGAKAGTARKVEISTQAGTARQS